MGHLTPLCAVPPALQSYQQVWHSEGVAGGTAVWTVRNIASVTQHRHMPSTTQLTHTAASSRAAQRRASAHRSAAPRSPRHRRPLLRPAVHLQQ